MRTHCLNGHPAFAIVFAIEKRLNARSLHAQVKAERPRKEAERHYSRLFAHQAFMILRLRDKIVVPHVVPQRFFAKDPFVADFLGWQFFLSDEPRHRLLGNAD